MKRLLLPLTLLLLATTTAAFAGNDAQQPEAATATPPAITAPAEAPAPSGKAMVVAAHPLAVDAGYKILQEGGNALDAAIATQMVLNVVEPQSSGIGGGGFLLYYDAKEKKLHAYDGRETAPDGVTENLFTNEFGEVLAFDDAVQSGISVGVPGLVRMFGLAYARHGKLGWNKLFGDAIAAAKEGFPMSPRLHQLLAGNSRLERYASSFKPFLTEKNELKEEGDIITNPELAATFETLSLKGPEVFYKGKIADDLVEAVRFASHYPGSMDANDLRDYRAEEREPVCGQYHDYEVCSMPPPSSGGIAIIQALRILEKLKTPIAKEKPLSAGAAHLFVEASKLAYADRNRYVGDPDFVEVPVAGLLNDDYLKLRAALINPKKASVAIAEAGDPTLYPEQPKTDDGVSPQPEPPSTTHISVVDAEGNAVSLTTSIEQGFGSGLSSGGFLLNNQLTDFSFTPTLDDEHATPHPNRVQPGKRPRSSMSPTMVFDKGHKLILVVGSPGGGRIIEYVLQTLVGVLDWKLDIQSAINLPHYLTLNLGTVELEKGTDAAKLKSGLQAMGHKVSVEDAGSGLHGIEISSDGNLTGGADPRREGVAKGF